MFTKGLFLCYHSSIVKRLSKNELKAIKMGKAKASLLLKHLLKRLTCFSKTARRRMIWGNILNSLSLTTLK